MFVTSWFNLISCFPVISCVHVCIVIIWDDILSVLVGTCIPVCVLMLFIQNTQLKWSLLKERHHHHLMVSDWEEWSRDTCMLWEGEDMVEQGRVMYYSSNQSYHNDGDNIILQCTIDHHYHEQLCMYWGAVFGLQNLFELSLPLTLECHTCTWGVAQDTTWTIIVILQVTCTLCSWMNMNYIKHWKIHILKGWVHKLVLCLMCV